MSESVFSNPNAVGASAPGLPAEAWAKEGGRAPPTGSDSQPVEPTILVGPTPAQLPVGMDILGRPFSEPVLLKIAGAFEQATHHRHPPPDFGPVLQ